MRVQQGAVDAFLMIPFTIVDLSKSGQLAE
jgi:hypothetical protein